MPLGPQQTWNAPPSFEATDQQNWATWVTTVLQNLQGTSAAPIPPQVTTIPHPGAVQIVWNEVSQATSYAVYETTTAISAPGVPLAVVPANVQAISNSAIRPNLNDTVTRFYSVVTITQFGRSSPSSAIPGAALAVGATVIPVSNRPVNQNGVGGGIGGGGGIYSIRPGVTR